MTDRARNDLQPLAVQGQRICPLVNLWVRVRVREPPQEEPHDGPLKVS